MFSAFSHSPCVAREPSGTFPGQVATGEQALGERAEHDRADAQVTDRVEQGLGLPLADQLHVPVEHGAAGLVDQQRGAQLAEQSGGLPGLRRRVVGDADVPGLPAGHSGLQGAHRLRHRHRGVRPVAVEDVDVVEACPGQRLVQGGQQVLAGAAVAVRPVRHPVPGLGRDHELVPVGPQVVGEHLAEALLRRTGRRPVVVRQVDVRDAQVERAEQGGPLRLVPVGVAEVVPQAEREHREIQAAAAGPTVGHGCVALRRGGVRRHARHTRAGPVRDSRGAPRHVPRAPDRREHR